MGRLLVLVVLLVATPVDGRADALPRDPADLIADGDAHERDGRWERARAAWEALARHAGHVGYAHYRQARLALELGDAEHAALLAARAVREPRVPALETKLVYGDALFVVGEHRRARAIYVALAARETAAPPATRARIDRRIVSANRALRLPDGDGLSGPSPGPEPELGPHPPTRTIAPLPPGSTSPPSTSPRGGAPAAAPARIAPPARGRGRVRPARAPARPRQDPFSTARPRGR